MAKTAKIILFISFLSLWLSSFDYVYSKTSIITVDDITQLQIIGKNCIFFEDTLGTLTINDIIEPKNQKRFQQNNKDVFNRPGTPSAFWFKFSACNNTTEDIWLDVGTTYAWYVDFFPPDSSGNYKIKIETGTLRPDNAKYYDVNTFWLPLNKANDSIAKTYYIRIKSGLAVEIPLHVGTLRALHKNKTTNDYITAGFVGLMIIMFLYNLFIYISIKSKIYFFYLGYIFMMLISLPYSNNYPFIQDLNFWFFTKSWWQENFLFWHMFSYIFIAEFCVRYLNLEKNSKILQNVIRIEAIFLSTVFPILTLMGFTFVDLVSFSEVSVMTFYLTCILTGYYFTFKKYKPAYFFTAGWTFMVIGVFLFFAVINGIIPYNPISRNVGYLGTAIEVWLFSLALGNRLNSLQKEKEVIQLENLQLITKQNENLEFKVKERTEELTATNEELVQSNEELHVLTEKLDLQSRELKNINDAKDRLFAIISHDLRSPLITLKNLLELASNKIIDANMFNETSARIKCEVEHIYYTLENLLQWSMSQMEGFKLKFETIDLLPVVKEIEQLCSLNAHEKEISIIIGVKEKTSVYANPNSLKLILRNLVSNAIKFTPQKGTITINAKKVDNHCQVTVEDTGVGISGELLEKLFIHQSVESNFGTDGEKGTGLGLILCQDFVRRNNGKIWAESESGKGTRIYFTIPVETLGLI